MSLRVVAAHASIDLVPSADREEALALARTRAEDSGHPHVVWEDDEVIATFVGDQVCDDYWRRMAAVRRLYTTDPSPRALEVLSILGAGSVSASSQFDRHAAAIELNDHEMRSCHQRARRRWQAGQAMVCRCLGLGEPRPGIVAATPTRGDLPLVSIPGATDHVCGSAEIEPRVTSTVVRLGLDVMIPARAAAEVEGLTPQRWIEAAIRTHLRRRA